MLRATRNLIVLVVVFCMQNAGPSPVGAADQFGVEQLFPTLAQGREWFAQWDTARVIPPYTVDPLDPCFRSSDKPLPIATGVAAVKAGVTRLMVLTPPPQPGNAALAPWRNVEMTIYARRGDSTRRHSYQAIDLSARSGERHNDRAPCDGTSYHATARFDGQCGFKKEIWHTGGYTGLRPSPTPAPWPTVPKGKWIGMKFVCRNCDGDQHVKLELYLDREDRNEWKLASEFTDDGEWRGRRDGCDRPRNYVITEARPVVYFRTDNTDVELKKFSVREIAPLP